MDLATKVLLLIAAVLLLIAAVALIRRRQSLERKRATRENPFAASTEGEKRCPNCGMGNLWTDRNCISCKARLPG